jgi:hypothetical protein
MLSTLAAIQCCVLQVTNSVVKSSSSSSSSSPYRKRKDNPAKSEFITGCDP